MHRLQTMTTNYADDAGLTSANPLSNGGELEEFGPSPADDSIVKMGKPPYINCCPTGTLEFVAGPEEDCCGAVEATVAALQTRMSLHPPKIMVLYGSLRKDSVSRKLAIEVGRILASYGADVKVFDPTDLPIFSVGVDETPKVKEIRSLVMWCEAMVWISPEVHGNIAAAFKNQVDWMPLSMGAIRPTQGKTCAVMQVEAGSQSFNTVNNLRILARWMRMVCVPNQVSIPKAYNEFDGETGEMKPSSTRDRVVDVVDELFKFTLLFRDQQPYFLQRYSEKQVIAKENLEATTKMVDADFIKGLNSGDKKPNLVIIDVRSTKEVELCNGGEPVQGSINVPLNVDGQPQSKHQTTASEFYKKLKAAGVWPADKETTFVTHCTAGNTPYIGRGARAAALLRDLGYPNSYNGGSTDHIRESLS